MKFNFLKNKAFISVTLVCGFLVIFVFGVWVGKAGAYCVQQPEGINFSLFWDAYNTAQASFVDPENIDEQQIIYGAIRGMTESLGDPYTSFFDPNEAEKFEEDLQGSFGGIGVEIGIKDNFIVVVAPLKDTPGEKAGLKSGDVISQIDGKSTAGMSSDDAVDLIRGEEGTDVTLTIYREEWENQKNSL
jgi:carboxyl-terminal processing protease